RPTAEVEHEIGLIHRRSVLPSFRQQTTRREWLCLRSDNVDRNRREELAAAGAERIRGGTSLGPGQPRRWIIAKREVDDRRHAEPPECRWDDHRCWRRRR